jgi:hypothetical protein
MGREFKGCSLCSDTVLLKTVFNEGERSSRLTVRFKPPNR